MDHYFHQQFKSAHFSHVTCKDFCLCQQSPLNITTQLRVVAFLFQLFVQCHSINWVSSRKSSSLACTKWMSRRSRSPPEVHFRKRNCGEAVRRLRPIDAEVLSSICRVSHCHTFPLLIFSCWWACIKYLLSHPKTLRTLTVSQSHSHVVVIHFSLSLSRSFLFSFQLMISIERQKSSCELWTKRHANVESVAWPEMMNW